MHALILQDWCTVGGQAFAGGNTLTVQEEAGWLDTTPYQDVFLYLDVREVSAGGGTLTMRYETSPIEDDGFFAAGALVADFSLAVGLLRTDVRLNSGTVAVARFLRWAITAASATSAWDATFRILVTANSPGT